MSSITRFLAQRSASQPISRRPAMLPTSTSEISSATAPCARPRSSREEQLQVLHGAADRADRGHAAERQQVEGGLPEDLDDRVIAGCRTGRVCQWRAVSRHGGLAQEIGERQGDDDHQHAEDLRAPGASRARSVSACATSGTSAPPDADPEVGDAHRRPRPASNQRDSSTWFGSGPPRDVAERVHQVEGVEDRERRDAAEADRARARRAGCPASISRRGPNGRRRRLRRSRRAARSRAWRTRCRR